MPPRRGDHDPFMERALGQEGLGAISNTPLRAVQEPESSILMSHSDHEWEELLWK